MKKSVRPREKTEKRGQKKGKKPVIGFRPKDDIRALLDAAKKTSASQRRLTYTDVIQDCIRLAINDVMEGYRREDEAAKLSQAEALERIKGKKKPDYGTESDRNQAGGEEEKN